ncbi:hotdog fold thioesterase [Flexivirga sp.]|uniref:hotdog fold thioesterase n=1 Tax=Flexivirga sp. TaxID=1962927 RepID=UPI003F801EE2
MTDNTAQSPTPATGPAAAPELVRLFNDMNAGTLGEKMGIVFVAASPERIVATMPVAGNNQPYGLLHGGASVVLAETLGSVGAALHAGEGRIAVGLDINATHHRGVRSGLVTGTATPLSLGRTLASYEVVITDEDGRRLCTSRITCLLRDSAPKAE